MTRPKPGVAAPRSVIRCAVYTRKSSEEGLEQEFNSLHAQRDSAEAFIASQKNEGWVCLPESYDDGGYTGGNVERPALQRLMADIQAGKVDAVVVYKVDRLSRSLLDFARLMSIFDEHKVSFVSVTQQFNTTHSMGRLTLNILLSFAQFEREIISERTRDKIAASKRKGKWVGGRPVLGYDIQDGRLVVNPAEAARVREIFETYLRTESIRRTLEHVKGLGWTTKSWTTQGGQAVGGVRVVQSTLHRLLTSPVYIGKVALGTELYPGEHEAIIDEALWNRVQAMLVTNGRGGGSEVRNKHGALLKGLLRCGACDQAMGHTYTTTKKGVCHRYYVCYKAKSEGYHACPSGSLPAGQLERLVVDRLRALGRDRQLVDHILELARAQDQARIEDLEARGRALQRELKWAGSGGTTEETLEIERRIAEVDQQIRELRRSLIRRDQAESASAAFEPLWNALSGRERAEVIRLVVEQVEYDGAAGEMRISFHPEHALLAQGAA